MLPHEPSQEGLLGRAQRAGCPDKDLASPSSLAGTRSHGSGGAAALVVAEGLDVGHPALPVDHRLRMEGPDRLLTLAVVAVAALGGRP